MDLSLALVCLLSAFVSKGYALTCISCTNSSQTLCTGSSITCSSTEVCTTLYTVTKINAYRSTSYSFQRGCGQPSECNQPKTLRNQFITISMNTGCCNTDNCTPSEPTVSVSTVQNGLVCPSCFTLTSSTCVPTTDIQCTGEETRCTTYSISTNTVPSNPILGMAGCATQNLCANFNGTTSTNTTGPMRINIICSNATVSPTTSTITSFISTNKPIQTSTPLLTNVSSTTKSSLSTSTPYVTSESSTPKSSLSTSTHRVTSESSTTKSSLPISTTKPILPISTTAKSTETNRPTSVVSGSHFTTDIANPRSTNSTSAHYTTLVTFTPTIFHSSTRQIIATTTCVCKGCQTHSSIFSLGLVIIGTLIKQMN